MRGDPSCYSTFYTLPKSQEKSHLPTSLLHSSARGVENLNCHQIVTKPGPKRPQIGEIQKIEIRSI